MKTTVTLARIVLGSLFLVFGLNGFLHFIPMKAPTGLAGQYMGALYLSHYLVVVFAVQITAGALLLSNRFVALSLVLLGPIVVNILLFHSLMAPEGLPVALTATVLWAIVFSGFRAAFSGVFAAKIEV